MGAAVAAGATLVLLIAAALYVWRDERVPRIERIYPAAAQPGWTGTLREPGSSAPLADGRVRCYDPATGYVLDNFPADTPASIHEKVGRAVAAQTAWATSTFAQRRRVLRTMHAWIQRDREPIARMACRDTGKTVRKACVADAGH